MRQAEENNLMYHNKMVAGKLFLAIISFLILVFLDQYTKYLIVQNMNLFDSIPVIKDVFEIHYIQNTGTAWGLLAGKQFIMIICSCFVFFIGLIMMVRCIKIEKYKELQVLIVLVLAGGIGNFIDRIRLGYVIDFLYFKLINFPVFNVADCYVTVALFVLLFLFFFKYKEEDLDYLFHFKR